LLFSKRNMLQKYISRIEKCTSSWQRIISRMQEKSFRDACSSFQLLREKIHTAASSVTTRSDVIRLAEHNIRFHPRIPLSTLFFFPIARQDLYTTASASIFPPDTITTGITRTFVKYVRTRNSLNYVPGSQCRIQRTCPRDRDETRRVPREPSRKPELHPIE